MGEGFGSPRPTNLRFSWLVRHGSSNPNTSDQIKMAFAYVERTKCSLQQKNENENLNKLRADQAISIPVNKKTS